MQDILTLEEVAARTRVPAATLRFWRHQGTGPHSWKLGRRVVYRAGDVDQWMEAQYAAGVGTEVPEPAA